MRRPAPRLGLERLRELADGPAGSGGRWQHRILGIDGIGRVTLPAEVRALGPVTAAGVGAVRRQVAWVLGRSGDAGQARIDRRGRVALPGWLRRAAASTGTVLVSSAVAEGSPTVIVPAEICDVLVDSVLSDTDGTVPPAVHGAEASRSATGPDDDAAACAGTGTGEVG